VADIKLIYILLRVYNYIYDKKRGNIMYLSVTFPPEWDALVSTGTNIVCRSAVSSAVLSIFS
jgi:hypothetical protein